MLDQLYLALTTAINHNASEELIATPKENPTVIEKIVEVPAGISDIETDFVWNTIAVVAKDEAILDGLRYEKNGQMVEWEAAEENELDGKRISMLLFSSQPRNTLRIESDGPKKLTVTLTNVETNNPLENLVAFSEPEWGGLGSGIKTPRYFTRSDWGADESLRVWRSGQGLVPRGFSESLPEAVWADKKEYPAKVTDVNEKGEKLIWPIERNVKIAKFVIHHTGEYIDEHRDPKELMRAVYAYHTITRGWGDIGYNFVIDQQGNVYEGRAGGPTAVGAHVAFYNLGTIGISLMGNFEREPIIPQQIQVLKIFLADLARRYDVDLTAESNHLGITSPNVSTHQEVARDGWGTICPGKSIALIMEEIRRNASVFKKQLIRQEQYQKSGRDFLAYKSPYWSTKTAEENINSEPFKPLIEIEQLPDPIVFNRGKKKIFSITVRNGSQYVWPAGSSFIVLNAPEGMSTSRIRNRDIIEPGREGEFFGVAKIDNTPAGDYQFEIFPLMVSVPIEFRPTFSIPIRINRGIMDLLKVSIMDTPTVVKNESERNIAPGRQSDSVEITPAESSQEPQKTGFDSPLVKIKLSFLTQKFLELDAKEELFVYDRDRLLANVQPEKTIKIIPQEYEGKFIVRTNGREWTIEKPRIRTHNAEGIIRIKNYDRGLGKVPYNRFHYEISPHIVTSEKPEMIVVNTLPIEIYLRGLAEEPSSEPDEKKHAIHILARSYALAYSGERRKFKTDLYDLEDSPATSQFYLGYDWEYYHPEQKKLLEETTGKTITYGGKTVVGPYFTQSSGESSGKWSHAYPWTQKQLLPYDRGLPQKGHGVGLSGNTARELAKRNYSAEDILHFFFRDIEVEKVY